MSDFSEFDGQVSHRVIDHLHGGWLEDLVLGRRDMQATCFRQLNGACRMRIGSYRHRRIEIWGVAGKQAQIGKGGGIAAPF